MSWLGTESYLAIDTILENLEKELRIFYSLPDGQLCSIDNLHVYYENAQYYAVCNSTRKKQGYCGYNAINFLYETNDMVKFIDHEGTTFDTYIVVEGKHPNIFLRCSGYKKPKKSRFNLLPFSYTQKSA